MVSNTVPPSVSQIPATAIGLIATIYTFQTSFSSDHMMHTFGRTLNTPNSYLWDNQIYALNTQLNDIVITHCGDTGMVFYYGEAHGTNIIPLKANGAFDSYLGLGLCAIRQIERYLTTIPKCR